MIRIAGSVSKSWLARRLGVAFDYDYYFDPRRRHEIDRSCNECVRSELGDLNVFYTESNLGRIEHFANDQVLVGGIQPNMIVGMLVGAEFLPADTADADITPRCLEGVAPADLPSPDSLLKHPLVLRFDDQIRSILADRRLRPIPPFFWDDSGRAAVHGAVTSGLKFYGDSFFLDMAVDAERCERVVHWLTQISLTLVAHFAEVAEMSVRGIHVGECVSCMLDHDSFCRYVVPATSEIGRHFSALRFHSCGRSDHVIPACREIRGLSSLDVGGETSVAVIRDQFGGEMPVGIAPTVEHMASGSADGILQWFGQICQENEGGDLTVGFHLEADFNVENIRALHQAVDQLE